MQSYLQYRRIGQAVRKQLERDQEKAAHLAQSSHDVSTVGQNPVDDPARYVVPSQPSPAAGREGQNFDHESAQATSETEAELEAISSGDEDTSETHDHGMHRIATVTTRHSQRTALGHSLTGIHPRDRTTHEGKNGKVFVVGWEGPDDPLSPRNYSTPYRVAITLIVSSISIVVGAAASIDSAILPQASAEFGVSEVVESLSVGIFLIGFGCGAFFAGPFSEVLGRNIVYAGSLAIYMIWLMAAALSPNIGAQLVFRFLAGFFGCTPLTCAGGSIADMWDPLEKTFGFPLFAIAGFGGPVLGPVIGSYIGVGSLPSWRWTEWIMLIFSALVLGLILLFMPETYAPLLLEWKAKHLRREENTPVNPPVSAPVIWYSSVRTAQNESTDGSFSASAATRFKSCSILAVGAFFGRMSITTMCSPAGGALVWPPDDRVKNPQRGSPAASFGGPGFCRFC